MNDRSTLLGKSLTTWIKNNPINFTRCINELVDKFTFRLTIDMIKADIQKISQLYKITIGYCLITSDLNKLPTLINDSHSLEVLTNTLINGNLPLKVHKQLVFQFQNLLADIKNSYLVNNELDKARLKIYTHLTKLYFNRTTYYEAIRIVHDDFLEVFNFDTER
jgi:hypothetical protein